MNGGVAGRAHSAPSDVVSLVADGPLAARAMAWRRMSGEEVATIIAKVTYEVVPGECAIAAPDPIFEVDQHWEGGASSVRTPSDWAPMRVAPEVTLSGSAFSAGGRPTTRVTARLATQSVDKSLEAWAPRLFSPSGDLLVGVPRATFPLAYEHAGGGPTTDNPVGPEPGVDDDVPSLQPPGLVWRGPTTHVPPVSFGPLCASWPVRRSLLRREDEVWLVAPHVLPMPRAFDVRYFQAAPPDQRLDEPIASDARILLESLHPDVERLVTSLPGFEPLLVLFDPQDEVRRMRADAMHIDTDRRSVTVTWRHEIVALAGTCIRAIVTLRRSGDTLYFPDVKQLREHHMLRAEPRRNVDPTEQTRSEYVSAPASSALPFDGGRAPAKIAPAAPPPGAAPKGHAHPPGVLPFAGSQLGRPSAPPPASSRSAPPPPPRRSRPPSLSTERALPTAPASPGTLAEPDTSDAPPMGETMEAPAYDPRFGPAKPASVAPPPQRSVAPPPPPSSVSRPPPPPPPAPALPAEPQKKKDNDAFAKAFGGAAKRGSAAQPPAAPHAPTPAEGGGGGAAALKLAPSPAAPAASPAAPAPVPPAPVQPGPSAPLPAPPPMQLLQQPPPAPLSNPGRPYEPMSAPLPPPPPPVATPSYLVNAPVQASQGLEGASRAAPPAAVLSSPSREGSRSARELSDDAAAASRAPAPRAKQEEPEGPARRAVVDLLYAQPELMTRVDRDPALRERTAVSSFGLRRAGEAAREKESGPEVDRLRILKLLSCAEPLMGGDLRAALDERLASSAGFEMPLLLIEGELQPSFDEVETLKLMLAATQPLSGNDKKLGGLVKVAAEMLGSSWPPTGDAALGLARQLEQAAKEAAIPARYLSQQVERALLEARHFKRRNVFGGPHLRADFASARDGAHLPMYVDEAVIPKLPLLSSIRVIALGELRPQEDNAETHADAFLALALARRVDVRRR